MRILIVEDEYLIASGVEAALKQAGWEIAGMVSSVPEALQTIGEGKCDAAVLDANLNGVSAEPIAAELRQRGIPFLVMSGYASQQRKGELARAPFLGKPFRSADLVASVRALQP